MPELLDYDKLLTLKQYSPDPLETNSPLNRLHSPAVRRVLEQEKFLEVSGVLMQGDGMEAH